MQTIVLASGNTHKVQEVSKILTSVKVESIQQYVPVFEVEETGRSYEENALLKAREAYKITKKAVIADDSGINVVALGNGPGIYSARFLGNSSYTLKNNTIIQVCKEVGVFDASFTCVIAYIDDLGNEKLFRYDLHGKIADKISGENGFGYDPIFIPNGFDCTMAQLSEEQKNMISHRKNALQKLENYLNQSSTIHVVLFEPEIPQNTGNIMRTCAATNVHLHLIKPLGFQLDEAKMRRSGMDYIHQLHYDVYENWEDFVDKNPSEHYYFLTRYAQKSHSAFQYPQDKDIYFVLGKESSGIDKNILQKYLSNCIRLPMQKDARSLNLSNCAAIIVYEALRQREYHGLSSVEVLKGANFLKEFNHEEN